MAKYDVISFLSDMGTSDESVAVCKAIMMGQCPDVSFVDITHEIPQFDVRAGALALTRAIQYLRPGIVVAAVDPGSPRDQRYIAVQLETGVLIGPDNGILAPASQLIGQPQLVVELTNIEFQVDSPGEVFAARDILAPAAGLIANGTPLHEFGSAIPLEQLVPGMLQLSRHDEGGALLGEVWSVDRFGNVQLNITPDELADRHVVPGSKIVVRISDRDYMATYVEHYADLAVGQIGVLMDSSGMTSIVKNLDYAASELGVREGKEIILLPEGTSYTGRDVPVEEMSTPSGPPPSIEQQAQDLSQGLAQFQAAPVAEPPVQAAASEVIPTVPSAPVDPFGVPTPPAVDPFAGAPSVPASDPFAAPPEAPPADPFGTPPVAPPVIPSEAEGSSYPSAPPENYTPTDQYSPPPAPAAPLVPDHFSSAPVDPYASVPQTPVPPEQFGSVPSAPVDPFGVPTPPAVDPFATPPAPPAQAPAEQYGSFPAESSQSEAATNSTSTWGAPTPTYADSPAPYFPAPETQQPPVAPPAVPPVGIPDAAPSYGTAPAQSDQPRPEGIPENVFDLFKNDDEQSSDDKGSAGN